MFTLKFLSGWNPWLFLLLAVFLAGSAWILYRRELRSLGLGSSQWTLPMLRSSAIFLIVLTLAEPAIESRHREGEPGHIHFLIDGSRSMSLADQLEDSRSSDNANRFQRAIAGLVNPTSGICDQISEQFDVSIWRSDASDNILLWKSDLNSETVSSEDTEQWIPSQWSSRSAIGDSLTQLREQISGRDGEKKTDSAQSIIVLLSDGQSNFGSSTQSAAEELSKSNITVTTIGFGPEQQISDLVLKAFEVPQRLFKTDQLSGRIIIADTITPRSSYQVQILIGDEVIWQQSLQAQAEQQREIRFDMPMIDVYQRAIEKLPGNVQYNSLPIKLTARLVTSSQEQSVDNNQVDAHFTVGASKAQILLVDGRSRWETRYLKNLFSRDPAWQISSVIGDGDASKLPRNRAEWQAYHLVLLGDAPASLWNASLQTELIEFVNRGGGVIVSDGARKHLHAVDYMNMAALLPVRLQVAQPIAATGARWSTHLTLAGKQIAALNLVTNNTRSNSEERRDIAEDVNAKYWKQLPNLDFIQSTSLTTGGETLVEATYNGQTQPLMVKRRFGAGQVLYIASDETWRWRYKVADQIHQRLWNQLARWVMRKPMSIESEFVSLDTGAASYTLGSPIEILAALRQSNGSPAENRKTVAVITRANELVTRVNLVPDDSNPGFYTGSISDLQLASANQLPIGEYKVTIEAEGFTKEALTAQSSFAVIQPNLNSELFSTNCDSDSLKAISQVTGGQYLHESRFSQLPELLRPLSGGKIVHSTRLIWQSYYWFFAALALLAIEWVLRKRAGLI